MSCPTARGASVAGRQLAKVIVAELVVRHGTPSCGRPRSAAVDMSDQLEQVSAVHRRIGEPGRRPVAVGVQAPAASADDRAFLAGQAEPSQSLLARDDAGVLPDHVESVAEDVQAGGGCAVEGGLEGIDLFVGAVGLDDHETRRREPERLSEILPAAQRGQDRLERPDTCGAAIGDPPVEYGDQPVGVLAVRGRTASGRVVPGGVGQEKIDPGRGQRQQCVVDRHRVVGDVDGAQQSRVQMTEPLRSQQRDGTDHVIVTTAPVSVSAMAVICDLVAVDGDADLYTVFREQLAEFPV